ncbi:MAG: DNA-processing protein DprA [Muribaculaceae bacterium]
MNYDELTYRIAFASVSNMGIELAKKFLDVLPSEKDFFAISQRELQLITNSKSKITSSDYRNKKLEMAKREIDFIAKNNIKPLYFTDKDYPSRLLNAPDAPIMVYGMGDCDLNAKHMIAIVGTRHATPYGKKMVDRFVEDISAELSDTIVVSGLAYGVDIAAHEACLKHNVPTIAVLAHGLNTIYPSIHRRYAVDIVHSNGMLLTDYTSQSIMNRGNFVARNRIVAALTDCTIVVESAQKGGALITARIAQSYNREVFAVPGRIYDDYSSGCNKLIQQNGASIFTDFNSLVDAMQWHTNTSVSTPRQQSLFPELSPEEDAVLKLLKDNDCMHINTITTALQKPVYQLLGIMVELEFKGLVHALPGSRYTLA